MFRRLVLAILEPICRAADAALDAFGDDECPCAERCDGCDCWGGPA